MTRPAIFWYALETRTVGVALRFGRTCVGTSRLRALDAASPAMLAWIARRS